MVYLYLLLSISFTIAHAEETKTLGSKLLEQVEDKTPPFDVEQCRADLELVYSKLSSVYTVDLQSEPFLIETFFDWEMSHRIAVPLIFSTDSDAYAQYVKTASEILTKYSSARTLSNVPSNLVDLDNDYNQVEIPNNGGKIPIYLVENQNSVLEYSIPYECFESSRIDLHFYDNYIEYYVSSLFSVGAQFQFLSSGGGGISGRALLSNSSQVNRAQDFFTNDRYDDENVSDFSGHIYVGYLPKNRYKTSIIVDTGHDDTSYRSDGYYEVSVHQAANPLVLRPGFLNKERQTTVVNSTSMVLYFEVAEHTKDMLHSIDQFFVQFYTPAFESSSPSISGRVGATSTKSSVTMKVLENNDNHRYQIAIGQTLDAELAIAEAKKYALQSFVKDSVSVSPFFSQSQKTLFIQRILQDSESFIEEASLDLYLDSPMESEVADNFVFTAVVTLDGEQLMKLVLQDYPTPTAVNIAPLITTYQETMNTREKCQSTLRSIYELTPSFWKLKQNGDIQIAEQNLDMVTLTIPIQLFIDEKSFGDFTEKVSTMMSLNAYPLVESGAIQIANNAGVPWGDTKGEIRWYLAQSGVVQNGSIFVKGYRLPCGLSDDDAERLVYAVQENNMVRVQVLDTAGGILVSESFNLARDYHDSYTGNLYNPGTERNDELYPLVGLNIIGPWYFGADGKNANGYYHTEYYPSKTFAQVINKEIVLTLSKETVKQIATVKTELDLYDLEF